MEFLDVVINFLHSDFSGGFSFLKVLGALLSLVFLGAIIMTWYGMMNSSERIKEKREAHFNIQKEKSSPRKARWEEISRMFKSPNPTEWRMAIIDADTMLEELVTEMGYYGDTFGEKLKAIQRQGIAWTDAAWDVHLLRNKLAHEGSNYPLTDREAFRAYKIYENILVSEGYLA